MDISEKKFAISTHYLIYGAPQALRDYLIQNKAGELLYISIPLFADGNRIYFEKIKKGRPVEKRESRLRTRFVLVNYLIGFFFTLKKCIESGKKIDVFIGVDNLNAFF